MIVGPVCNTLTHLHRPQLVLRQTCAQHTENIAHLTDEETEAQKGIAAFFGVSWQIHSRDENRIGRTACQLRTLGIHSSLTLTWSTKIPTTFLYRADKASFS